MLQKLSELFGAGRAPTGYRPGVTLEHLRRNLGVNGFEQSGPASAQVRLDDGLQLEVRERTESQLFMHLVMTEFVLRVPALSEGTACFELHHGGAIRRTAVRCRQRSGDRSLQVALEAGLQPGSALHQALMPLDFKRLRIDLQDRQWCVRLEHMGGSEVVNRMPAFRRYIALSREQRDSLFQALAGLQRLLRTC
ncbi:DUF3156 family protein [Pseudomonas vanderleydeniana]|uniref:DUF3156 family protein n=1 Tax=Pseudomonas vanderleydeniana TaxID=2745495 RepID=A0A9E6PQ57_9PSED|nr:DUF3156 family protein [Pseudomonas vanderleydeniana]QXI30543.1 DUF3156 family protein [Pseudomonas vanderleydeniana]